MSALRKLRQAKLKQAEESLQESTSVIAEEEQEIPNKSQQPINSFALLNADEEEENQVQVEEEPENTQLEEKIEATVKPQKQQKSKSLNNTGNPQGNAKKNKKNNKQGNKSSSIVNSPPISTASDDELDRVLDELKINPSTNSNSESKSSAENQNSSVFGANWSVLKCESKYFDADLEVRQRFGAQTIKKNKQQISAEDENNPANQKRNNRIRGQRNGKNNIISTSLSGSKLRFVKPLSDWPSFQSRGEIKLIQIQTNQLVHTNNNNNSNNSNNNDSKSNNNNTYTTTTHIPYLVAGLGCKLLHFSSTPSFKQLRSEFLSVLHSQDIHNCYYFSRSQPYFPHSALQIAELSASQQEFIQSHLAIQRALYYFQQNSTQNLLDLSGKCRIDPNAGENTDLNRVFFEALVLHAQALGKKSCPRTALEILKFTLSLAPLLDPHCITLFIDYYVLRSREYRYLFDLVRELDNDILTHFSPRKHPWNQQNNNNNSNNNNTNSNSNNAVAPRPPLILLPNIVYGLALCKLYMENSSSSNNNSSNEELKIESYEGEIALPTLPFTFSYPQNTAITISSSATSSSSNNAADLTQFSASHLLQRAILLFPEAIEQLLIKSGNEKEVEKSDWKSLLKQLNSLHKTQSPYIEKLILVFSERSATLYKNATIMNWIRREAQTVVNKLNSNSNNNKSFNAILAQFSHLRAQFLHGIVPESIRLLQKSSYTDTVASLPPGLIMAQAEERFVGGEQMNLDELQQYVNQMTAAGQRPLDLNAGPLRLFLESLMPWNIPTLEQQQRALQQAAPQIILNNNNNNENRAGQEDLLEPVVAAAEGGFNFDDYQFSEEEGEEIQEIEYTFHDAAHDENNSNNQEQ